MSWYSDMRGEVLEVITEKENGFYVNNPNGENHPQRNWFVHKEDVGYVVGIDLVKE
jgi:hypothetical protein